MIYNDGKKPEFPFDGDVYFFDDEWWAVARGLYHSTSVTLERYDYASVSVSVFDPRKGRE